MSILSYGELTELVGLGVIDADYSRVKGSSIDVLLDDVILIEDEPKFNLVVDLRGKESISTCEFMLTDTHGYQMQPGEFVLGSTKEFLALPNDISAEFRLKSSIARNGLEQLNACWIDPGFHGKLTLELVNVTRKHKLVLKPDMPIGQLKFIRHDPVPEHMSYGVIGQYQNQQKATASKGVR